VAQERIRALAVAADPFLTMSGDKIVALAARAAVPAMYEFRGQVAAGGLMSYAPSINDAIPSSRHLCRTHPQRR
jgi:hypothetical protein